MPVASQLSVVLFLQLPINSSQFNAQLKSIPNSLSSAVQLLLLISDPCTGIHWEYQDLLAFLFIYKRSQKSSSPFFKRGKKKKLTTLPLRILLRNLGFFSLGFLNLMSNLSSVVRRRSIASFYIPQNPRFCIDMNEKPNGNNKCKTQPLVEIVTCH